MNDLYNNEVSVTVTQLLDLLDTLHFALNIPKIVVCQTIYQKTPVVRSRYQVNIETFTNKVDSFNTELDAAFKCHCHGQNYGVLKGFGSRKL